MEVQATATAMAGLSVASPNPADGSPSNAGDRAQAEAADASSAAEEPLEISEHKRKELAGELLPEMLLEENEARFVLFPIQHDDIWAEYKKEVASFWTAEELDLAADQKDWEQKLSANERHFVR